MRHTHYPQGLVMSPPGGLDYLKMPMQAMHLGPNGELIPTSMQSHHHGHASSGECTLYRPVHPIMSKRFFLQIACANISFPVHFLC